MLLDIPGDTLVHLEVYTSGAMLVALLAWLVFPKLPIARIALLAVIVLLCGAAFRPADYNTDTGNYYSYVLRLSYLSFGEVIFASKLEPVHSIMSMLLQDFRLWLIGEAILEGLGLYLCYRVRKNDQGFIVLCCFLLTLTTSSLRYSGALAFFMFFVYSSSDRIVASARMTLILVCFHASMLMSGLLAFRKVAAPLLVILICSVILYERSLLGSRVDDSFSDTSGGLKSLAVVAGTTGYLWLRGWRRISAYHILFAASMGVIFLVVNLVLPTFNRFLIMGALVLLAKEWGVLRNGVESDVVDRAFILALSVLIVVPYIVVMPERYFAGTW